MVRANNARGESFIWVVSVLAQRQGRLAVAANCLEVVVLAKHAADLVWGRTSGHETAQSMQAFTDQSYSVHERTTACRCPSTSFVKNCKLVPAVCSFSSKSSRDSTRER